MNSFLGFIVGLLQTTLSLLGFVQANPQLPQPVQDQAIQVAQQALTQATNAIATSTSDLSNPSAFSASPTFGSAPLAVTFLYPHDAYIYAIDFGDGQTNPSVPTTCPFSNSGCSISFSHSYSSPGSYTAKLLRANRCPMNLPCDLSAPYITMGTAKITVGANSQSISVPGMSKYTDADFGFSFWYPSGWEITADPGEADAGRYPSGGVVVNTLTIQSGERQIHIEEVNSTYGDPSITDLPGTYSIEQYTCTMKDCGTVTYFFQHPSWMMETNQGTSVADVSDNTMGGLHMLKGASMYDTIIPLSTRNFLVAHEGNDNPRILEKTILATDPSVATPVSVADQIKTILFEQAIFSSNSNDDTDNSLDAAPLTGQAPLKVDFTAGPSAGDETLIFGDGQTSDSPEYGCSPQAEGCSIGAHVSHTYTTPGVYKVFLYRHMPSVAIGFVTITVTQ